MIYSLEWRGQEQSVLGVVGPEPGASCEATDLATHVRSWLYARLSIGEGFAIVSQLDRCKKLDVPQTSSSRPQR